MPFPSPGDLLDPGIELTSPVLAVRFGTSEPPRKSTINATLSVTENVRDTIWIFFLVHFILRERELQGGEDSRRGRGLSFGNP